MTNNEKIGSAPERIRDAEQFAQMLKTEFGENQNIIAMLGNAFASGVRVGMRTSVADKFLNPQMPEKETVAV